MAEIDPALIVVIDYTDPAAASGVKRYRIWPLRIVFFNNEWYLRALNIDRNAWAHFAMKDIHQWTPGTNQ